MTRRRGLLLANLALVALASSTHAAPPDDTAREPSAEVRSIQGLSRYILGSRGRHAATRGDLQLLRERLTELSKALADVEADPAPVQIDRLGDRRAGAVTAWRGIRARTASESDANRPDTTNADTRRPTHGARDSGASVDVAAEMAALWWDVDCVLADPIGQRARLGVAQRRIAAALESPGDVHSQGITLLSDLVARDGR